MSDTKTPLPCARCNRVVQVKQTASGAARPPIGWTRIGDGYWCGDCWSDAYFVRATSIAIAPSDGDWNALRARLRSAFGVARSLANWAYSRLLATEPPRDPAADKMPKKASVYLYGIAKESFPHWGAIPAALANAVLKQVESDYSADRFDLWCGRKSSRSYTYPQPLPVPCQCWDLVKTDEGFGAKLNLGDGQVVLKLGLRRHQQKIVEMVFANPLLRAGVKIVEKRSHGRDTNARDNSGGQVFKSSLRLEMSYYAPRLTSEPGDAALRVQTGASGLLVAIRDDNEIWSYHADHAKRLVAKHAAHLQRLQRLGDDRKAERRRPARDNRPYEAMVDAVCESDRNRMTSLCHEASASLVSFARRQRVATIIYDDKDKSFCASFPWAKLSTMIQQKARDARINVEMVSASGSVPNRKRSSIAETEVQ